MITIVQSPADDVWQRTPLTWRGLKMKDGRRSATVSCANGHYGGIWDHEIAGDGTVNPSLICPGPGCGWHEFVKLEGWSPQPAVPDIQIPAFAGLFRRGTPPDKTEYPSHCYAAELTGESGYCWACGQPILWGYTNKGNRAPFDVGVNVNHWITCRERAKVAARKAKARR